LGSQDGLGRVTPWWCFLCGAAQMGRRGERETGDAADSVSQLVIIGVTQIDDVVGVVGV
jgi:hypothetical protein